MVKYEQQFDIPDDDSTSGSGSDDDLVTVTTANTEFHANTLVALLEDAGIKAFAFAHVHGSLPLESRRIQVPVQVRKVDFDRATQVLANRLDEASRIDWQNVDVGETDVRDQRIEERDTSSEPSSPLGTRSSEPARSSGMPIVARLGFYAAIAFLIVFLGMMIVAVILAVF